MEELPLLASLKKWRQLTFLLDMKETVCVGERDSFRQQQKIKPPILCVRRVARRHRQTGKSYSRSSERHFFSFYDCDPAMHPNI